MLEKIFKIWIINTGQRWTASCWRRCCHITVLMMKRWQYFSYLCNDLLNSGIRFLENKEEKLKMWNLNDTILVFKYFKSNSYWNKWKVIGQWRLPDKYLWRHLLNDSHLATDSWIFNFKHKNEIENSK